ncbi:hypothetical protein ACFLY6_02760 [Candidatus Dependentiae bacterium]
MKLNRLLILYVFFAAVPVRSAGSFQELWGKVSSIRFDKLDDEALKAFERHAKPVFEDVLEPTIKEVFRVSHLFDSKFWTEKEGDSGPYKWVKAAKSEFFNKSATLSGLGAAFLVDKILKNMLEEGVGEKNRIKQCLWQALFAFWGTHIKNRENLARFLAISGVFVPLWTFLNTSRAKAIDECTDQKERERIRSISSLSLKIRRAIRNTACAITAISLGYAISADPNQPGSMRLFK